MSGTRLALAVIGDEIGPSLPEMLSFCTEQKVRRLDMRTVDGRNLLDPAEAVAAGFTALLVVRVLTVVDDNLIRWLTIGLGKHAAGAAGTAIVLTIAAACVHGLGMAAGLGSMGWV